MTKKDTIILAVLLNIVVLAGVLVTAFQVLPKTEIKQQKYVPYTVEEQKSGDADSQDETVAFDEIDQLLEEYGSKESPAKETPSQPVPVKKEPEKQQPPKKVDKNAFYVVRPGDNPWKIAKKFHISFERLLELNNLDETKAKNLKVGQTLRIKE
jgi:LysM repeat protein